MADADDRARTAGYARLGDRLTAECREQALAGRAGIYDARVNNQNGELLALFRGKSATVKGTWVE